MGKGDKKSKKGKIAIGSYGNSRRRSSVKARFKRVAASKAEGAEESVKPKKTAKKKSEE